MKKRMLLIATVLTALAVTTASAEGTAAAPHEYREPSIDKYDSEAIVPVPGEDGLRSVTKEEFQTLEREVTELRYIVENSPESTDDSNLGTILLSLFTGIAGGIAGAFLFKYISANSPENSKTHHRQYQGSIPSPNTSRSKPPTSVTLDSANREQKLNCSDTPHSQAQSQVDKTPSTPPTSKIEKKHSSDQPAMNTQKISRSKTAYGYIMIHSADLMIVEDSALSNAPEGMPFKFELNEDSGIATYTFSSNILSSLISNLSTYEQMIEPFAYLSGAKSASVDQPGTLRHMDGYWKVEKKIKISLK